MPLALRRLVPSAYRPVLANRVFRRLIFGFGVSYLGDGMSFLAVAWLAIELAPQATAGLWVGAAVAAYTLPGVVGALVFGRRLRRVPARRLLLADNVVRGVSLGVVPLAWLAGLLSLPLYVALLAGSSLGTFSTRFTELVGMSPSVYRDQGARTTAGMPPCVAKQVTRPIRNREAPASEPRLA